MAGIGFQLEQMGREGGLGGIASAAIHGAVISSGPWLLTVCAVFMLQRWTGSHMASADHVVVQTIFVYAFSASVVIAAPLSMIATRIASDRMYAADRDAVPSVLLAALTWATVPALLAGNLIFGMAAALPPEMMFLATAILTLLTHIWIAGPFLTATKRHRPILAAYLAGMVAAALPIFLLGSLGPVALLAIIAGALTITVSLLVATIKGEFPTPPSWPRNGIEDIRRVTHLGLAGLANALALWIDKWLLWWGPDSVATIGVLRLNPINDQASFLGLLTLVPGLTLMLIVSETRFENAFSKLMDRCIGTSSRSHIEEGRREVAQTILRDLRLLIVAQAVLAAVCWVLAPEIFRSLGIDARGIFAFRLTVLGVIFHLVVIHATIVLSYYDLFGRILAIWLLFVAASAIGTLACWNMGFASFGWGYLAGAVAAASLALALVADATMHLTYLLFVSNNPAVVGDVRYWI